MFARALLIRGSARLGGWSVLRLAVVGAFAFQASAFAQATDPHAGHGMAGMSMAGMTPPAPGVAVVLNAASPDAPITVRGSPGQITVAFPEPVIITSLTITNAVGQQIPNRMTLPADPVRSVGIPVVIPLQAGRYKVAWRATGKGLPTVGTGSFNVQLADGSDPATAAMHHHP